MSTIRIGHGSVDRIYMHCRIAYWAFRFGMIMMDMCGQDGYFGFWLLMDLGLEILAGYLISPLRFYTVSPLWHLILFPPFSFAKAFSFGWSCFPLKNLSLFAGDGKRRPESNKKFGWQKRQFLQEDQKGKSYFDFFFSIQRRHTWEEHELWPLMITTTRTTTLTTKIPDDAFLLAVKILVCGSSSNHRYCDIYYYPAHHCSVRPSFCRPSRAPLSLRGVFGAIYFPPSFS